MPNDNTHDTTAGDAAEHRGPGGGAQDTEGGAGKGASASGPESTSEGGSGRGPAKVAATPAENQQHDDDSTSPDAIDVSDILADLTNPKPEKAAEAPAAEATDDDAPEDDDAEKAEPEAEDDEGTDAEKDEAAEEGDEKPDDEAETDADDPFTPEERKRLSKRMNRELDKLARLKPAARLGADIEARASKGFPKLVDLQRWIDTGVRLQTASDEEAAKTAVDLALSVTTNGKASKMSPAERAQHLRSLADKISPAPQPRVITLSDELREAVDAKALSAEEAQRIQLDRLEAKEGKPAEKKPAERRDEVAEERQREEPTGPSREEFAKGVNDAKKVYREYQTKYPDDWKRVEKEVVKRVEARAPKVHPSAFADLVRDQIEIVLGPKRAAAKPKTPPKSPVPSGRRESERANSDETSDDDLLAMTIGEKPFPKRR